VGHSLHSAPRSSRLLPPWLSSYSVALVMRRPRVQLPSEALIRNRRTGKTLAKNEIICQSAWSKARGLMFSKQRNLVFIFRNEDIQSLHMFFVFYPIDVVFLNAQKRIVDIKENFLPFTCHSSKKHACMVLELQKGAVKRTGTKTGDFINISSL
jgi:uncharacterized membrane protein (UPF0127 family)